MNQYRRSSCALFLVALLLAFKGADVGSMSGLLDSLRQLAGLIHEVYQKINVLEELLTLRRCIIFPSDMMKMVYNLGIMMLRLSEEW